MSPAHSVVRVVGGVCVELDGDDMRVLAFRRAAHKSMAGFWEFPGGKVEPGESDAAALERELLEELGVRASVGDHVATSQAAVGDATIELACYFVTFAEHPTESADHDRIEWMRLADIDPITWAPADRVALEALARG